MISNTINWKDVGDFLVFAWQVCEIYNGSITSGCRSKKRNKEIGAEDESKHTFAFGWGMGVDIVFDTEEGKRAAVAYIKLHKPQYHVYIGTNYSPERIHLQGWQYQQKPYWRP